MVKVFVIDDTGSSLEPLGKAAGNDCEIYCLDEVIYHSSESIDDFVGRTLLDNVWKLAPDCSMPAGCLADLAPTDSVAIFVIHAHSKVTANSYRQSQDGVEVLKHIRLTEELGHLRNAHVLLCSFEDPIALLARKPENLILLSKGTTLLRLPDTERELEQRTFLDARAALKAEVSVEDFGPYVRCDYHEVDRPHQFSNWWGLHRIAHARRLLKPDTQVVTAEIVVRNLGLLESKKTRFLLDHEIAETTDGTNLTRLSGPVRETDVVYVDDEEAWGSTLSKYLEEDLVNLSVRYLPPPDWKKTNNDDALRKWVSKSLLAGPKPSVVLLDLRLGGKDRDEIRVPVSETSGAWIARIIRELDRGIPIVLMTASNKAHTFEAAMKLGIDAYWMKEGIGEHAPQGGSCRNYARLLELIALAVGSQCQFLRRFADQVEALKSKPANSLWWEDKKWIRECRARGSDREKVIHLLDGIVTLLREYLRLFAFGYGTKQTAIEQGWLSALMVEGIKILELVHHLELARFRDDSISLSKLAGDRGDEWGKALNKQRRFGAHALEGTYHLRFEHTQSVLAGVMAWLRDDPRGNATANVQDTQKYQYLKGDGDFDSVSSRRAE